MQCAASAPPRGPPAADGHESSLLNTVADLVFRYLPLGVQAIALPALSKAWKQWAPDERAKERALQQRVRYEITPRTIELLGFDVPLWAAQQLQQQLSDGQKRRFQLRAVALGDVAAVDYFGVGTCLSHDRRVCSWAALGGRLDALQWLGERGCD